MDVRRIKELIDLVAVADIAELTVSDTNGEVQITQRVGIECVGLTAKLDDASPAPRAMPSPLAEAAPEPAAQHHVQAPMVGTFHRAAKADAAPLVDVGAMVDVGTPLCVIEAMKIMNEIEADKAGRVVEVLCEDGQAVEMGQPMFAIA